MEFKSYSSLENHHNGKFISKIRELALDSGEWVAREKIHGTNFSVIITADSITPCKRSGPILPSEGFFGYEIIMKRYAKSFEDIQRSLTITGYDSVQVFGEFAGTGIQKGVDYGEKDFYVFDILVSVDEKSKYLEDKSVKEIVSRYGLKIAPLIGRGTFEDLIKLPNDFQIIVKDYNAVHHAVGGDFVANNRIWETRLGTDNIAEGYVLKPNTPAWLPNGARVAIKCKNSKFSEKAKSDKLIQPPKELSDIDKDVLMKFSEYATWNRVSNVISKWGEVNAKDFGKVLGLTMQDIFVEAGREGLEISDAEDPALVKKQIQKLVGEVIRERWSEVVS